MLCIWLCQGENSGYILDAVCYKRITNDQVVDGVCVFSDRQVVLVVSSTAATHSRLVWVGISIYLLDGSGGLFDHVFCPRSEGGCMCHKLM